MTADNGLLDARHNGLISAAWHVTEAGRRYRRAACLSNIVNRDLFRFSTTQPTLTWKSRELIMSSSSELEAKFRKAAWLIANGPKNESASTEYKLDFYSHFKQATEGDVTGSQPWMTQLQARAKWDAW